jgi:hydroxymethylpyrimidine kinase/phosphomethylpyrimidine kinase
LSVIPAEYSGALVVDPVLVAGDGRRLVDDAAIAAYQARLFPRATIVTPNLDEAEILTGQPVRSVEAMQEAARALHRSGVRRVLIKGGHLPEQTHMVDVLFDGSDMHLFSAPYMAAANSRGTGCTFASCIAAEVAKGATPLQAVHIAKAYVTEALRAALDWDIGHGRGTLFHSVGRPPIKAE